MNQTDVLATTLLGFLVLVVLFVLYAWADDWLDRNFRTPRLIRFILAVVMAVGLPAVGLPLMFFIGRFLLSLI